MVEVARTVIACKLEHSASATRNPTFFQHTTTVDSRTRGNDGIEDFGNV